MVKLSNSGSEFYYNKITFEDETGPKEVYTDNVSEYQIMAEKFSNRIKNMQVFTVEPTQEQIDRLAIVNKQANGQDVEGWSKQINTFVEHGYLDHTCPEFLKSQISKFRETSKAYLVKKLKAILSLHKTEKEQGGCVFQNSLIKTDSDSQAKITGTLIMMQSGAIPTVDFKAANGWLTLNAEQFKQLALAVATHAQVCFKAESIVIGELESKTLDDLVALDPDYRDPCVKDNGSGNHKLIDLYEATYKSLLASAIASVGTKKSK